MTGPNPYRTAFLAAIAIAVLGIAGMIGYLCFVSDAHATVLADPALDPGAVPEVEAGPIAPTMTSAPAQPAPATGGLPWEVWLAIGIAALAGIETIVRGMRAVLGLIAPRTKTTLDDEALAKLDRLDEEMMRVLNTVRGRSAPPAPPQRQEPDPDPTEHSRIGSVAHITKGVTGSGLACLIIALGVGVVQPACATARPRIAAGVGAALDCNAPGIVGTFAGALVLAASAVESWISGDGTIDAEKLVTAASKLKSDQERCALATVLAIAATPTTPEPDAPASAPLEVDADAMRAAFAQVKAQWGVVAVATEGGVI